MSRLINLWERPTANEINMIAGWHQWADAGSISSGLPQYLIEKLNARKIGELNSEGYYLFQIPGTHHFLRPQIKLEDGYRKSLEKPENSFYYAPNGDKGLIIFLGDEPHLNVHRYAEAFFEAVAALGVSRVAGVGGVYGAMPYNKERSFSCVYSLPDMKEELSRYAVRFSNYQGGTTIGSYLLDRAEYVNAPYLCLYGFVPAYNFPVESQDYQGIRIENDFKAWYDLLRRLNHLFGLQIDLTELAAQSETLEASMDAQLAELANKMPELNIKTYLAEVTRGFTENTFMPLDDVWERELGDLFDDFSG